MTFNSFSLVDLLSFLTDCEDRLWKILSLLSQMHVIFLASTELIVKLKVMKRISLFLAICLVSLSSFAQSADKGLIKGQILNATNNEAFSMVNVAVFSLPDSVLVTGSASNDAGYFELKNIEYGTYLLKISFVGYDTREINCELSSLNSEFDAGIITLRESAQKIGDVEIVTAKP